jgi:hypothetical protein
MSKRTQLAKRAAPDTYEMSPEPGDPRGPGPAGPRTVAEALAQFELQPAVDRSVPNLGFSARQLGAIEAGRARQAQLQQFLEERRALFENAGVLINLVGIEYFELTHRPCGRDWLVSVEQGLPSSDCPWCGRGA